MQHFTIDEYFTCTHLQFIKNKLLLRCWYLYVLLLFIIHDYVQICQLPKSLPLLFVIEIHPPLSAAWLEVHHYPFTRPRQSPSAPANNTPVETTDEQNNAIFQLRWFARSQLAITRLGHAWRRAVDSHLRRRPLPRSRRLDSTLHAL